MEKSNGLEAFENFEIAFLAIHSMVRPTMVMFAAMFAAKLIVDELKTRTLSLVFMYSISRIKVMLTKITLRSCNLSNRIKFIIAMLTMLGGNPLFMPVLGLSGIIAAYFSTRKVKHADL